MNSIKQISGIKQREKEMEEYVNFSFQIESDEETFDKSLEDEKVWLYEEIGLDMEK